MTKFTGLFGLQHICNKSPTAGSEPDMSTSYKQLTGSKHSQFSEFWLLGREAVTSVVDIQNDTFPARD